MTYAIFQRRTTSTSLQLIHALRAVDSQSSWKTGSSGKQLLTVPEHARQSRVVLCHLQFKYLNFRAIHTCKYPSYHYYKTFCSISNGLNHTLEYYCNCTKQYQTVPGCHFVMVHHSIFLLLLFHMMILFL